jgi:hypothetical protein
MKLKRPVFGYALVSLCIALLAIMAPIVNAQSSSSEEGLGYSEGPFALIDNPTSATGATPLQAAQAAAANTEVMTQDVSFTLDAGGEQYAFIGVTADFIGNSVVLVRSGNEDWRFVCRHGGVMAAEELVERCGLSQSISNQLREGLLEAISRET